MPSFFAMFGVRDGNFYSYYIIQAHSGLTPEDYKGLSPAGFLGF
jgi:hypothetical protein